MNGSGERVLGPQVVLEGLFHAHAPQRGPTVPVLGGLTLEIAPGETVALVGPSGSGKTTLLDVISGRVQPHRGQVSFKPERASIRQARVFQESALLPWRTVAENVRLPLELLGILPGREEAVERALRLAAVDEFRAFLPRMLSGGLASRAAIARALVTQPGLLLLDEPFGSLDEITAEAVMVELAGILERLRPTTVLVTHSLTQAVFLADRVLVLSRRPATIAGIVTIERAAPRSEAFLTDAVFQGKVLEVRDLLRAACA